jgi:hypothetical protein
VSLEVAAAAVSADISTTMIERASGAIPNGELNRVRPRL